MICLYDVYEKALGYERPTVKIEMYECNTKELFEYIRNMKGDNDEKIAIPKD